MRASTIICLLLLICRTAIGQTYSNAISDKEIYDFLSWITKNEKKHDEAPKHKRKVVSNKISAWDSSNFIKANIDSTNLIQVLPDYFDDDFRYIYKEKVQGIFTPADKEFIFKQFLGQADSIWHTPFPKAILWTKGKQRKTNKYFYSIPLFSIDKRHVVVREVYYCGNVCSYGGYKIYERVELNSWRLIATVNGWMS